MKHLVVFAGLLFAATSMLAQQKPPASPPAKATGTIGGHEITVTYSSPGVKGREGKIFTADGLIKTAHGSQYPIWRGGANAATTLHTDAGMMIGDLMVPAGTYTLFVDISNPDAWTLIVNKKTGEWGIPYKYESDELARVDMKVSKLPAPVENFTIAYDKSAGGCTLRIDWETTRASVDISAK